MEVKTKNTADETAEEKTSGEVKKTSPQKRKADDTTTMEVEEVTRLVCVEDLFSFSLFHLVLFFLSFFF